MTEIKSAIEWFEDFIGFYSLSEDEKKMFQLAIRSLQAWSEVLQELEEQKIAFYQNGAFLTSNAIQSIIDLINQHLAEIEEVR